MRTAFIRQVLDISTRRTKTLTYLLSTARSSLARELPCQ